MQKTLKVINFNASGFGVGKIESGQVVFIPGAVPGDEVTIEVTEIPEKRVLGAKLEAIVNPSANRIQHPCPYYNDGCMGSTLGVYEEKAELEWKKNNLREVLKRIGKIRDAVIEDIIESPRKWGYRERVERQIFNSDGGLKLGYSAGEKFVPIENCLLSDEIVSAAVIKIGNVIRSAADAQLEESARIVLRNNGKGGCAGLVFVMNKRDAVKVKEMLSKTGLTGLQIRIMKSVDSRFFKAEFYYEEGDTSIDRDLCASRIKFQPTVFSQINMEMEKVLREKVVEQLPENSSILDLFGGFGGWSMEYVKTKGGQAVVVESSKNAVRAGKTFVKKNDAEAEFIKADLGNFDFAQIADHHFDCIIADPPRGGLHDQVLDYIDNSGCALVLYVSCHPAVLARDISRLKNYRHEKFIPLDMFPNTPDLETITVLRKIQFQSGE